MIDSLPAASPWMGLPRSTPRDRAAIRPGREHRRSVIPMKGRGRRLPRGQIRSPTVAAQREANRESIPKVNRKTENRCNLHFYGKIAFIESSIFNTL
jgi:hypothetical protein